MALVDVTQSATPTDGPSASPTDESATPTSAGDATDTPTDAPTETPTGTPTDGTTPTTAPDGSQSPGAAAPADASSTVDPHNDGNGCDDIIHAADRTPGPGGPIGCTVGNSGDHRQNGKNFATATPTDTATATDTPTDATPTADATDSADPHSNGHGCDDVNPAVTDGQPNHGGPVDCTVGNSGDHRQNGKNGGTATPETTPAQRSHGRLLLTRQRQWERQRQGQERRLT